MSTRVAIEHRADGRIVAVKRATPDHAARLAAEAEVLARARHPGVVRLLEYSTAPDGSARLVTSYVGPRTLSTRPPTSVDALAAVVAAVASTLADLHALGVTHGRLDASHVLVDPRGRPVLCGFGTGGEPGDDVAALADVMVSPLLDDDDDWEPIPDRRSFVRPRRWRGYRRRALLNLADRARDDHHQRRPTAAAFATAVREVVPGAELVPDEPARSERGIDDGASPGSDIREEVVPAHRHGRAAAVTVAGTALVGVVALTVGLGFWRPASGDGPGRQTVRSHHDEAGGLVEWEGRHYRVGDDGDRIALGDWDCDGDVTPGLLRPTTGEIFVFDRWAGVDQDAHAPLVAVVRDARSIRPVARGDGCDDLVVTDQSGADHVPGLGSEGSR